MLRRAAELGCVMGFLFVVQAVSDARAAAVRYVLEGNYRDEVDTVEGLRGGSFRITADFDPSDLLSSTASTASYSNDGITVETFDTVEELNEFFALPAFLLVSEATGTDDSLNVQMAFLVNHHPFLPTFAVAAFSVAFPDESLVSGVPPGLPVFDESNGALNLPPIAALDDIDLGSVVFQGVVVPEPSAGGLGLLGLIGLITWRRHAPTNKR